MSLSSGTYVIEFGSGSAKMQKIRFGIKRIARMEGIMPRGCEKDASNLAGLEIPGKQPPHIRHHANLLGRMNMQPKLLANWSRGLLFHHTPMVPSAARQRHQRGCKNQRSGKSKHKMQYCAAKSIAGLGIALSSSRGLR